MIARSFFFLLAPVLYLSGVIEVGAQQSARAMRQDFRVAKPTATEALLDSNPHWRPAISNNTDVVKLRNQLRQVNIGNRRYYVSEGDLLLDEASFLLYARDRLDITNTPVAGLPAVFRPRKPGTVDLFIIGIEVDGKKVRWEDPRLSYCVRSNSFASDVQYRTVVSNMLEAASAWMSVCNVTFEHQAKFDTGPMPIDPNDATPTPITFIVEGFNVGGEFIASAFFPNEPGYRRRIWIDPSYFAPGMQYDSVGVLRHELGHVLGFVHEHISSGAPPICPTDAPPGKPVKLTDYDPHSVMHYFCGGVGSRELTLTEKDLIGAQILYGAPPSSIVLSR